jgi:hypothetical protein
MRKIIIAIFLIVMVAAAYNAFAQPAPGWSMYHNGPRGMGYSAAPSVLAGAPWAWPLWKKNAPGGIWGSPIEDVRNMAVVVATNQAGAELHVRDLWTGLNRPWSPLPLVGGWSDGTSCIDGFTNNLAIGSGGGGIGTMEFFNTAAAYAGVFVDQPINFQSTKVNTLEGWFYAVSDVAAGGTPGIYKWPTFGAPQALVQPLPSVDTWHGFVAIDPTALGGAGTLYYKDMGNPAGANETSVLYAVNPAGGIIWQTPPHGEGWGNIPPLVDSQGNIYQGFQDVDFDPDGQPGTGDEYSASTLEKYSPAGVMLWQAQFNGGGAWWHGGYALDPTEQFIYTQTRGGPPGANPMGGITQFNTANGIPNWSVYTQPAGPDPGGTIGDGFGAPAVDGAGFVYSVDHNGTFSSISPGGAVMFAVDGHHTSSWASPMISSETKHVYTTGDGGNIVCWAPIPEPMTMTLIGLGLLGILSRIRRKK